MKNRNFMAILCLLLFTLISPGASLFAAGDRLAHYEVARKDFKKGIVYFNNMQYLAAVEFFRKALSTYPDYYSARDYLARSYKLAGLSELALIEYEKAAGIYPEKISLKNKIDYLNFIKSGLESGIARKYVIKDVIKSAYLNRFSFKGAMDLVMDRENNIYIPAFTSNKVVKINIRGRGEDVFRPTLFGGLYGIDLRNGIFVVSDFKNDLVYMMTMKGKVLQRIGGTGNSKGKFHGPEGVSFDSKGNFYVVDSGNCRIQKFSSKGDFILAFGIKGEDEGYLYKPSDLAVLGDKLYITDSGKGVISVYDLWGNFFRDIKNDMISAPRGISLLGNLLLISDVKTGVFTYDPLTSATVKLAGERDSMRSLRAVASVQGHDGFLYVLDSALNRVYCLSPLKKQYTNLDLDITSIDAASYPTVAIYLNVRDRSGNPIYGLRSSNFKIKEDNSYSGRVYTNYLKNRKFNSASFVFLIDRRNSMRGSHGDIPWVADFVLKKMRVNDRAMIMNYNSGVWPGSKFSWSRRKALKEIRKRSYGAGDALGDALYRSVSELVPRLDHRSVFLVTRGKPENGAFDKYSPDVIIDYARAHFVQINIATFSKPNATLTRIAKETGGKIMRVSDVHGLRKIYDRVKKSPEYRYVLIYKSTKKVPRGEWWTDLKVEVEYRGQRGMEEGGYFVP